MRPFWTMSIFGVSSTKNTSLVGGILKQLKISDNILGFKLLN
jgi:hypothetical protein